MSHSYKVQDFAEGGLVNDRSGKATAALRKRLRGKRVVHPDDADDRSRGNPTLKRFRP